MQSIKDDANAINPIKDDANAVEQGRMQSNKEQGMRTRAEEVRGAEAGPPGAEMGGQRGAHPHGETGTEEKQNHVGAHEAPGPGHGHLHAPSQRETTRTEKT